MFYANAIIGYQGAELSFLSDAHIANDIYHLQANGVVRTVLSSFLNNNFVKNSWNKALDAGSKFEVYGQGLAAVSAGLTVLNVINNRGVKPSDVINLAMAGLSVSGFGSLIAGGYFVTDIGLKFFTGKGIGDRIDEAVNTPDHKLISW